MVDVPHYQMLDIVLPYHLCNSCRQFITNPHHLYILWISVLYLRYNMIVCIRLFPRCYTDIWTNMSLPDDNILVKISIFFLLYKDVVWMSDLIYYMVYHPDYLLQLRFLIHILVYHPQFMFGFYFLFICISLFLK